MSLASFPPVLPALGRDSLWQHARNSLSIARLLLQDGRPERSHRHRLRHRGRSRMPRGARPGWPLLRRRRVSAPWLAWPRRASSGSPTRLGPGPPTLAAAEHALAWIAGYLRSEAPERSWGF